LELVERSLSWVSILLDHLRLSGNFLPIYFPLSLPLERLAC